MIRQQTKMEINLVKFRREIRKHHSKAKLFEVLEAVRSRINLLLNLFVIEKMGLSKALEDRGQDKKLKVIHKLINAEGRQ